MGDIRTELQAPVVEAAWFESSLDAHSFLLLFYPRTLTGFLVGMYIVQCERELDSPPPERLNSN